MTSALRRTPGAGLFLGDDPWIVLLVLVLLVALGVWLYRQRR